MKPKRKCSKVKRPPSLLAARMAATALELEREARRQVGLALTAVADAIRPTVTGEAAKTSHPDAAAIPDSVRRLAVERTAPLFELFGAYDRQLLACLDDLAAYFSNPAEAPHAR